MTTFLSPADFAGENRWAGQHRGLRRLVGASSRPILIGLLFVLTLLAYGIPCMIVIVPAGHGGVLWRMFRGGTVSGPMLGEGLHIILPWDRATIYDMRQREETRTYSVIAGNGLTLQVDIGFLYRLQPNALSDLHRNVGPDYLNVLLVSQIGTVARQSIARWPAEALYSPERAKIEADIYEQLVDRTNRNNIGRRYARGAARDSEDHENYIELAAVMIREVRLPEQIQSAVGRKVEQQQLVLEYGYRLERERLESARKQVEAEGIRKFQETVQQGLTDRYLAWRGIEATLQVATSNNAKVVLIGNSANGLPLIFNTGSDAVRVKPTEPGDLAVPSATGRTVATPSVARIEGAAAAEGPRVPEAKRKTGEIAQPPPDGVSGKDPVQ